MKQLPVWNLTALYPKIDSPEFSRDLERLEAHREEILTLEKSPPRLPQEEAPWLERFITLFNKFTDLFEELYAF
ncbi:MAG TPA: hypothetical protein ENN69_04170, partial [Spirochaetia bacterium]|nr:hypothetical protein [Spirochaetia bacterium]